MVDTEKLKNLINEGQEIRKQAKASSMGGEYISGEDYETWIAKCILFLEKNYPNQTLTKKFIAASERAVGNGTEFYDTMIGVLKALKEHEEG